jgi:WD40 repeat protein
VEEFAFSADGQTLAALYTDGRIDLWAVAHRTVRLSLPSPWTRDQLEERQREGPQAAADPRVALSPDGQLLARSFGENGELGLWHARTGKPLPPLLDRPDRWICALVFSPDSTRLAACCLGQPVCLWDVKTRRLLYHLPCADCGAAHAAFSPDGKRLAGADGPRVTVWDLTSGKPAHEVGHTAQVWGLAFTPDGRTIVSGAGPCDNSIRFWDSATGKEMARCRALPDGIGLLAVSPDGRLVAAGGYSSVDQLWALPSGKEVRRLDTQDEATYALAFSPDGMRLAIGGIRKTLHLWDVQAGRELDSFGTVVGNRVGRVAFSPNGKLLATAEGDNTFRLWDVAARKELHRPAGHTASVHCLAFSPDGRFLATGAWDGTARLWQVVSGQLRLVLARQGRQQGARRDVVYGVAFSPDSRTLAAAYEDGSVCLWEIASAHQRAANAGHRDAALSLAFSPDGKLLASTSRDQTILVWDVASPSAASPSDGPDRRRLSAAWDELASPDAGAAYRAIQRLACVGDEAVRLLEEHLRPAPAADASRIARLVAALDNTRFAEREAASRDLVELGEVSEPALRGVLTARPSQELRRRAEAILEQLDPAHSLARLREVRAVEALEWIGTPSARQLLTVLAHGSPEVWLTREARGTLERLARRTSAK